MFTGAELSAVLSTADLSEAAWSPRIVEQYIVCQHGYTTHSSQAWLRRCPLCVIPACHRVCVCVQVQNLLIVMSELSPADKRRFLQFITGSPRLPIGGFAALSPRLTIVKATTAAGSHQDDKLPTCSTCQVYLKLPPYTSIDVLRDKLLLAIREGQEHFAMD